MSAVTPLERPRLAEAATALGRAFEADPTFVSLWPDPRRRARALPRFLAIPLDDALRHGSVDVALLDGRIAGAAAWYPPGAYPQDGGRQLRVVPRILAVGAVAPRSLRRLAELGGRIDAAFPDDMPAYLAVVGVAPEAQGRGLGNALLQAGLDRCDAAGADCYLETDTAAAARLYERLGFATVEAEAELLPGGPPHRRMRRPARPSGVAGPVDSHA